MTTPPPPRDPAASDSSDHHRPHGGRRALRRTVIRPAGAVPDPIDSAYVSNRLTFLTHELANLLDGSLRIMSMARRSLATTGADCLATRDGRPAEELERHIETVYAAMLQMAEVIRNTMTGLAPGGPDGLAGSLGAAGSLATALHHAADVMRPIADERAIHIDCEISDDLAHVPAEAIYGVAVGVIRNSIESIHRSGNGNGHILVKAWTERSHSDHRRSVAIDFIDDGEGPPRIRGDESRNVFTHGFTTKPGGSGVGLSVGREVMTHMGGSIELLPRPVDPVTGRGGAVLRLRYPAPIPRSSTLDRKVG